jgi:hypothetical protein
MHEIMNADLIAGIFTMALAVPGVGWLLWDCYKHETDRQD